MDSQLSIGKR